MRMITSPLDHHDLSLERRRATGNAVVHEAARDARLGLRDQGRVGLGHTQRLLEQLLSRLFAVEGGDAKARHRRRARATGRGVATGCSRPRPQVPYGSL